MWDRALEDVLAALRAALTGDPRLESDGIQPKDVVLRGKELLVIFQWQRDPAVYAFPVLLDDLSTSPWTGDPVESLEEWATDLVWLLDEELMTGYMAAATRQLVDGWIELRQPTRREDEGDERFDVAEVEDPGLPALLDEAGLDVAVPVRLAAEGRLLRWHAMYVDSDAFVPVGSVATRWDDAPTARLVHLETAPSLPVSAGLDLVRCAVSVAAGAGATTVVSDLLVPRAEILGFRAAGDGSLRLETHMLERDHVAMAALREEERREEQNDPAGSTGSRLADHVRRQRALRGVTGDYRTKVIIEPLNEDDPGQVCELDQSTRSRHDSGAVVDGAGRSGMVVTAHGTALFARSARERRMRREASVWESTLGSSTDRLHRNSRPSSQLRRRPVPSPFTPSQLRNGSRPDPEPSPSSAGSHAESRVVPKRRIPTATQPTCGFGVRASVGRRHSPNDRQGRLAGSSTGAQQRCGSPAAHRRAGGAHNHAITASRAETSSCGAHVAAVW